ncbi:hypothetical protein HEAR1427 [Herminiimonas arsenicoxydans]|uniref:Uncharacterized protein n=1 Tax=Herminiimonas arsenicoxydans TaxID=204773 RepID=A4G511_HERAR|nr:hypothetical protein HEAR1427 [Herminiimonas arsenicoxydans]
MQDTPSHGAYKGRIRGIRRLGLSKSKCEFAAKQSIFDVN